MSRFNGWAFYQLDANAVPELFAELSRCISVMMRSIDEVATCICGKKIDSGTLAGVRALAEGDHAIYDNFDMLRNAAEDLQDALECARDSTTDYAFDFDGSAVELAQAANESINKALFFMSEPVPEARW